MTKWANSLLRISNHEVETLQKRLVDIVERRVVVEQQIVALDKEVQDEIDNQHLYEASGIYLCGFRQGAKLRRKKFEDQLDLIAQEEMGARDALSEAFETLKKYEHVIEATKVAAIKEENKRETAALDELGLRRAMR